LIKIDLECTVLEFMNMCVFVFPHVVTGEENSPTAAHASRKRRLKWVPCAWGYSWSTLLHRL